MTDDPWAVVSHADAPPPVAAAKPDPPPKPRAERAERGAGQAMIPFTLQLAVPSDLAQQLTDLGEKIDRLTDALLQAAPQPAQRRDGES